MSFEVERLVHQCTVGDGVRPDGKRVAAQIRKVVLLSLANTADHDGSGCKAWIDRLCRSAEVSSRSVRRALASLEDDGFLVKVSEALRPVEGRAGLPSVYAIDLRTVRSHITHRDDELPESHGQLLTQGQSDVTQGHTEPSSVTHGTGQSDPRVPQGRSLRRSNTSSETDTTSDPVAAAEKIIIDRRVAAAPAKASPAAYRRAIEAQVAAECRPQIEELVSKFGMTAQQAAAQIDPHLAPRPQPPSIDELRARKTAELGPVVVSESGRRSGLAAARGVLEGDAR